MRRMVALLCFVAIAGAVAQAQSFESWNEVDLAAAWHRVTFTAPLLARTDTRLPNPQLAATGLLADIPLPWHLTLTPGYLFAELPQSSLQVHVPLVAVTEIVRVGPVSVADRNRFEKLYGYSNWPVRYRNRLFLDLPLGTKHGWHLFADDEVFFNLTAGNWNQNRAQAGCGARLNRRLLLDVYYLQRDTTAKSPETRVIGSTLRVNLTAPRERRPDLR